MTLDCAPQILLVIIGCLIMTLGGFKLVAVGLLEELRTEHTRRAATRRAAGEGGAGGDG